MQSLAYRVHTALKSVSKCIFVLTKKEYTRAMNYSDSPLKRSFLSHGDIGSEFLSYSVCLYEYIWYGFNQILCLGHIQVHRSVTTLSKQHNVHVDVVLHHSTTVYSVTERMCGMGERMFRNNVCTYQHR